MNPQLRLAATCLVVFLAACARAPTRPVAVVDTARAEQLQAAREQALAARPDWSFAGRVAVSTGGNGGSGRIEWAQHGADFDVRLSAPVTRQGWRLARAGGRVRLEGLEGGVREGTDAEALLLEATRWRLPVANLGAWVRGVRGGDAPARMEFTGDGLLAALEQAGWRIEYDGWTSEAVPLPMRIRATQGDARVRLAIEAWAPAP